MGDDVERVAKALFRSRYPYPEHEEYWPYRLDELVNGPPFTAEGYREMARAAIEAMKSEPVGAASYGIIKHMKQPTNGWPNT